MVELTLGVEKPEAHFRRDLLPALVYVVFGLRGHLSSSEGATSFHLPVQFHLSDYFLRVESTFVRKRSEEKGYRKRFKNCRTSRRVEIFLSNFKKFPGLNFVLL